MLGGNMGRVEIIKAFSRRLNASEIGGLIDLNASTIRKIASANSIRLRVDGKVFVGSPCRDCGRKERYKSCGACVHCKKELNKRRYVSNIVRFNNRLLLTSWTTN
jgi:hypothetical protein